MKLRIMGTMDECEQAQEHFLCLSSQSNVRYCSISELYPNRGSTGLYRVYIEISYNDGANPFAGGEE